MTDHTDGTGRSPAKPTQMLVWDAILALRAQRDAIEIAAGEITATLDALGDGAGLQAAVAAGYGWAAEDAADEIVALINASPSTPRADEIAAIIARVAASAFAAEDPLARKWERAVAEYQAACDRHPDPDDEEVCKLLERSSEATLAIWRRGARCVADLGLFARLASYWRWHEDDPALDADFQASLVPSDLELDEQALAQLVAATLKVTGKRD